MASIEMQQIAEEFKDMVRVQGLVPVIEIEYKAADTMWYLTVHLNVYQDKLYMELDNIGMPHFSGGWDVEYRYDVTHVVASTELSNYASLQDCLEDVYAECIQYITDSGYTLAD